MLPEQARSYTRALFTVVLMVFLALGLGLAQLTAQDGSADAPPEATADPVPTAEPTPVLLVSVSGSEPAQVLSGSAFTLSIFGANFTTTTLVRLPIR